MRSTRLPPYPGPRTPALLAAAALLLAGGCTSRLAEQALQAQTTLVGMPKQTLLSCAGVPARSAVADNQEFFTYRSDRVVSYPGSTFGFYGSRFHDGVYGLGFPAYYGPDIYSYTCEATFTLRNGVVERVVYGGPQGNQLSQCFYIVQNCLSQPPIPR